MKIDDVTYLGDELYVKIENNQLVLMANDAESSTDTVFLEEHVLDNFIAYLKKQGVIS
jgi:hypothetical protein